MGNNRGTTQNNTNYRTVTSIFSFTVKVNKTPVLTRNNLILAQCKAK